jgi:hypothetical protein
MVRPAGRASFRLPQNRVFQWCGSSATHTLSHLLTCSLPVYRRVNSFAKLLIHSYGILSARIRILLARLTENFGRVVLRNFVRRVGLSLFYHASTFLSILDGAVAKLLIPQSRATDYSRNCSTLCGH